MIPSPMVTEAFYEQVMAAIHEDKQDPPNPFSIATKVYPSSPGAHEPHRLKQTFLESLAALVCPCPRPCSEDPKILPCNRQKLAAHAAIGAINIRRPSPDLLTSAMGEKLTLRF